VPHQLQALSAHEAEEGATPINDKISKGGFMRITTSGGSSDAARGSGRCRYGMAASAFAAEVCKEVRVMVTAVQKRTC